MNKSSLPSVQENGSIIPDKGNRLPSSIQLKTGTESGNNLFHLKKDQATKHLENKGILPVSFTTHPFLIQYIY